MVELGLIGFLITGVYYKGKDLYDTASTNVLKYKKLTSQQSSVYNQKERRWYNVSELPTLPFESFKNFYSVNPDAWVLGEIVAYRKREAEINSPTNTIYNTKYVGGITFPSYWEYAKYQDFKTNLEKTSESVAKHRADRRKKQIQKEMLTEVLTMVQRDIDKCREEAFEDFAAAGEKAIEIAKRIN